MGVSTPSYVQYLRDVISQCESYVTRRSLVKAPAGAFAFILSFMTEGTPHEYKEQAGACTDCGNSPVNHIEMYWLQTFNVWISAHGKNGIRQSIHAFGERFLTWLEPALYRFLTVMPITKFAHDPNAASSYRSQVIWEEANRRGILMEQMVILGMHSEIYRARIRDRWFYFQSLPVPPALNGERYPYADDKYLLKEILGAEGIPVPHIVSATNVAEAKRKFAEFEGAVVVKPRSGSRARHTTVNVSSEGELKEAFRSAQRLCRYVALESYIRGGVCRGTVVNGRLVGFFQAYPPEITGDGMSTIEQLIQKKNNSKPERVQNVVLTDEHEQFLKRLGYSQQSVIPKDKIVALTHRTGRLFGGRTRELLGSEHPVLRQYLEHAAVILKTPVIGFDLIIENPESNPDAQRWGIIEANTLPFIDLHYLPLEGTPSNVAAHVWDLWNEQK